MDVGRISGRLPTSNYSARSMATGVISSVKFFRGNESLNFIISSLPGDKAPSNANKRPYILSPGVDATKGAIFDLDVEDDDVVQSIAGQIEKHYALENSEQFVGGMGENDGGVWITSDGDGDTLDYWEEIRGE